MSTNLRGFWKDQESPKAKPAYAKPIRLKKIRRCKAEKRKARDNAALKVAGVTPIGAPHPDYVKEDKFFKSRAWREMRYAVIKNCGGRCQACGASAADGVQLHVDHIIPRYKAPHLAIEISNMQCLCDDCNIGKGAWDSTDWREHFRSI